MKSNLIVYFYSFLLSFCFITLFSSSTSWIYHDVEYLDADFFSVIGKYWAKGFLPYVDLWDHKGPFIHFCNAIGYWIAGDRIGVYWIQVFSLSITFYFAYKLLRIEFAYKHSFLLLLLSLFGLLNDYSSAGNNVEEFLLPFLTLSIYLMYKWLHQVNEYDIQHPYKYSIVYGVVLGVSILTRMTNAIGICGGVAVIAIVLLYRRKWMNLLSNIFGFFIGVVIVVLPFILYFWYYGALDEMLYGTLWYNFEYANTAPDLDPFSFNQRLYLLKSAINGMSLLIVSLILIFMSNTRLNGFLWFMVSFSSLLWLMSGNGFHHYFIITYPFFCVLVNELYAFYKDKKNKNCYNLIFVYSSVLILACTYEICGTYKSIVSNNENLGFYNDVLTNIPENDRDSFIAYNVSPYIYLYMNVKPSCRFFAYQDAQISFVPSFRQKVQQDYSLCKAKWLLVKGHTTAISKLLEEKYRVVKSYNSNLKLYKRKS